MLKRCWRVWGRVMSNGDKVAPIRPELREFVERISDQILKSGDGGGTSDGMEERVKRLEARVDKFGDDVTELKINLATLTERVAHLPSKGFIVTSFATAVTIIGAIVLAADRLKGLFAG